MPQYLQYGTLLKYKTHFGQGNDLRDAYGLLNRQANVGIDIIGEIKEQFLKHTPIKLIVKGIMTVNDAILVQEHGADGIWVSDGGKDRQHYTPSSINVLHAIASASKARNPTCSVFIDSGITRGTDVMKCLAMGADAVFVNRPVMWALYKDGE